MSQQSRIIPNVLKAPDPLQKNPTKKKHARSSISIRWRWVMKLHSWGNPTKTWGGAIMHPILGSFTSYTSWKHRKQRNKQLKVVDLILKRMIVLVGFWTKNFGWSFFYTRMFGGLRRLHDSRIGLTTGNHGLKKTTSETKRPKRPNQSRSFLCWAPGKKHVFQSKLGNTNSNLSN